METNSSLLGWKSRVCLSHPPQLPPTLCRLSHSLYYGSCLEFQEMPRPVCVTPLLKVALVRCLSDAESHWPSVVIGRVRRKKGWYSGLCLELFRWKQLPTVSENYADEGAENEPKRWRKVADFKIKTMYNFMSEKQLYNWKEYLIIFDFFTTRPWCVIFTLKNIWVIALILKAVTIISSPCQSHTAHSHRPPPHTPSVPPADWPMQTLSSSSSAEALRKYPSLQCWQFWPLVLCLQLTHVTMFR